MQSPLYKSCYRSPLGTILLTADESGRLTGLRFGTNKLALFADEACNENTLPVLKRTAQWLDLYFSGREPDFEIPLHFTGTDFQQEVWQILCTIPYGKTLSYGDIAQRLAQKQGISRMSAQAVGGAVGRNPIAILVPCHRVIGADGSLTGYAAGLDRKKALLRLEKTL